MEIYRDLTAQQSFQSKLHKSERLASLGEKLGSVAHELSNPLTTILGYAQRLLRHAGNSRHREDIERIFSEADRASSILRQLLGATRESSAERRPVELNPLVRRTVELLRFQLASEKIRLELDLSSSLPAVLCDGDQLHQILTNLISNARHAVLTKTPPGSLFVRTRAAVNGRVIVEVADSGPGIPEADQQRIFDPFFTTKPAGIGTGLGLSIVMGLVRQNHGNIRVRSAPGEGATFSIDLPAANTLPEVVMPVIAAALSSPLPSSKMGRVLVVEDEPTVAQLIADMLCDLGYSSDVLHDARRAMVSALNRDYALIICDMKMPGLDGQHFYRALAEAGCLLAVKFLFVTGDVLSLATREFLRKHRLPHIAKPFRLEEFAEKLAVVLAPAPPGTSLQPADLADDLAVKNLIPHG
jgi:CheY-like chemotaxis protein/two-component sensor histidine kinase